MPGRKETLKSRPEMTKEEFMEEAKRVSIEMSEGSLTALSEMRDLLVRKEQDGMPVNLQELREDISPKEFLSLFVAQEILARLDANFGMHSTIGILPGGEIFLEEIAKDLGRALYESISHAIYYDVPTRLGDAIKGYGRLIEFTEDEACESIDLDNVRFF